MPRKKVEIKERKLGRGNLRGLADPETGLVEIDPRLPAKEWLSTLVHEALHVAFPAMTEKQILAAENKIAAYLWKAGVRRIYR